MRFQLYIPDLSDFVHHLILEIEDNALGAECNAVLN
jgi:hypothetical protein